MCELLQNKKNKKIRVGYIDMAKSLDSDGFHEDGMRFIHQRLSKYYDVEITTIKPDIVFCNFYGADFIKYDCIRVSVFSEEYAPNFNSYDYAITLFQDYQFKDRVLCLDFPIYYRNFEEIVNRALSRRNFTYFDLGIKTEFCSFVQSKCTGADSARIDFVNTLSKYKKINCGGKILNNVGGPVANKLEFETKHKFSISFINGKNYTLQDRPLDAFAAHTIPIYWGNPDICKTYNTKAFINCHDYACFEEVVEEIKRIDNDDDLFIKMMKEPIFVEDKSFQLEQEKFDAFLINIVEHGTIQRSGVYWNRVFEKETYRGRKRYTRTVRFANRFRPVTRLLFSSYIGQNVKHKILSLENRYANKVAYKKIK